MHPALETASNVFFDFSDVMLRILQYSRLTIEALNKLRDRLSADPQEVDTSTHDGLKRALAFERAADLVLLKDEEKSESLVYAQASVSMWSTLESHIDDQLLTLLRNDSGLLQLDDIKKVKVSLAEYYAMDDEQRIEYLLEEAKLALRSKLARGPAVFERVLDSFKFGGTIANETSRELTEFSAVRNCIVHRRGIVDRRFLAACSTTPFKLGQHILLTQDHASRYFWASLQYAATVQVRIAARYAPGMTKPQEHAHRLLQALQLEQGAASI